MTLQNSMHHMHQHQHKSLMPFMSSSAYDNFRCRSNSWSTDPGCHSSKSSASHIPNIFNSGSTQLANLKLAHPSYGYVKEQQAGSRDEPRKLISFSESENDTFSHVDHKRTHSHGDESDQRDRSVLGEQHRIDVNIARSVSDCTGNGRSNHNQVHNSQQHISVPFERMAIGRKSVRVNKRLSELQAYYKHPSYNTGQQYLPQQNPSRMGFHHNSVLMKSNQYPSIKQKPIAQATKLDIDLELQAVKVKKVPSSINFYFLLCLIVHAWI